MAKLVQPGGRPFDPISEKLIVDVARRGERPPQNQALPPRAAATDLPALTAPRRDREKRVLLTGDEENAVETFVRRLATELGTPVKLSHVLRSCLNLVLQAETSILQQARTRLPLARPPNGDPAALSAFENHLGEVLETALTRALPATSRYREQATSR